MTKLEFGQAGQVAAAHKMDEAGLAAHLAEKIAGFRGPLTVKQFHGGQSNPTYLLETPGRSYVLRRRPPGVLLPSAHAVDREFRVLKALHGAGFPVPEPLYYCDDTEIAGTSFYVMAFVKGRLFYDCTMPQVDKEQRRALYDAANETLARLHSLDPEAVGLGDFGRPGNYFERQVKRWSQQYASSKTGDIPEMDWLMDWLPRNLPEDSPARVIHGDYSFHNLLFHPERPEVVAVLDWELSTLGDPLADLMYHGMEWYRPSGIDPRGTLRDADLGALGTPSLREMVDRYCQRTGRPPVADLRFYKAFNLFRVAAIIQGIVGRLKSGSAVSSDAHEQEQRVRPLAQAAWRETQSQDEAAS